MEKPDIDEVLHQIDALEEELGKIRRKVISIRDGTEFNEEFNEDLYCDTNTYLECEWAIENIMQSIVEFRYGICSDKISIEKFYSSQFDINAYLDMGDSILNPLYVDRLKEDLIYCYNAANKYSKYSTYENIIQLLPKECPWTLEELMNLDIDIDVLASRLPELN